MSISLAAGFTVPSWVVNPGSGWLNVKLVKFGFLSSDIERIGLVWVKVSSTVSMATLPGLPAAPGSSLVPAAAGCATTGRVTIRVPVVSANTVTPALFSLFIVLA